jgi:hypothetical protein
MSTTPAPEFPMLSGAGVSPTIQQVISRADALDLRRRIQVHEQRKVIDRILKGGETLSAEFLRQQNEMVEAKARIEAALDVLREQRRPSPLVRRAIAALDPQQAPQIT